MNRGETRNNLFRFSILFLCFLRTGPPPRKINTMRQPYIHVDTRYSLFVFFVIFFMFYLQGTGTWFSPNHVDSGESHNRLFVFIVLSLYFHHKIHIFYYNIHRCTSTYFAGEERVELLHNLFVFILHSILMFQKSTSNQQTFVCSIVELHL